MRNIAKPYHSLYWAGYISPQYILTLYWIAELNLALYLSSAFYGIIVKMPSCEIVFLNYLSRQHMPRGKIKIYQKYIHCIFRWMKNIQIRLYLHQSSVPALVSMWIRIQGLISRWFQYGTDPSFDDQKYKILQLKKSYFLNKF